MANEVGTAYVDVAFDNRQVDREVSGLGSSMAGSFKRIAGVVAGAFVLDKVVDVVRDSIGAASDLNETVSKTGQVFRQSTPAMLKWGESSAEALGLSKTAALDGAASIGAMLIPMGTAPKRAAVMSRSMVQLAADMASFNNEDPSEMLDRIRAGLSGESEPLKRFGTVLSETRVQQFAWANGIAETGKQLTEQQKITARYGLLLQDTKTQQGDFARTSQGLANQQRILSAEWENAQASLGKALLPAAIAVTHALVDLIPVVVRVGNAITDGVGKAVAFVRPLFDALFGSTSSGSKEMSSDFEGVRAVAEPVFRAVGAVVKFAGEIFGTVTSGIRAHSDEIRATMQAIRAIFQAVWPAVSQIVQTAWAIVETTVRTAVRVVGDVIRAAMAILRGDWGTAWSALGDIPKAILSGAISVVKSLLTGAVPAIASLALKIGTAIVKSVATGLATLAAIIGRALLNGLKAAVSAAIDGAKAAAAAVGPAIVAGILGGLGGLLPSLAGSLKDKIGGAIGWVKGHLGSTAEEHAASQLGMPVARGVVLGWIQGTRDLPTKIGDTVRTAVDAGARAVDASRGRLTDAWGSLSSDLDRAFAAVWSKPTASEAALAKLRADAEQARRDAAISDARAQLVTATAGGDAQSILSAQRSLDDALLAQREFTLQQQAEVERRNADARAQLQQRNFDTALGKLQARLAQQGATQQQAQNAVLALLRKYGVRYADVADELGSAFVTQLKQSLAAATRAAREVADDIEDALRRVTRATASAKAKGSAAPAGLPAGLPSTLSPLTATGPGPLAAGAGGGAGLAGEVSPTRLLAGALARAMRDLQPPAAQADPSSLLDGLEVRVFVGDTELRGIVRHEVVQHDAGVASVLAAGAV